MTDCFCEKDADGECLPCRTGIQEYAQKITEVQLRASEEISQCISKAKHICHGCGEKYLDFAISKVISGMVEGDMAGACGWGALRAMVVQWIATLKGRGVDVTPLTIKAWNDICATQGWDPEL